jgi:hypothetical protein
MIMPEFLEKKVGFLLEENELFIFLKKKVWLLEVIDWEAFILLVLNLGEAQF